MLPRRLQRLPSRALPHGATVHEATTAGARLLGLALLRDGALPPGHALLIPHCRSVHTFGMRFRIDVLFLDERGRVLRIERAVPPRRVLACRRAFAVLETRAGDAGLFLSPPRPRGARGAASEP
jgi:uncharacterized membrane protein (UPF0127 family)